MSSGALRVGVIGAAGRMGSETCRAVAAADGLELVAALERGDALEGLMENGASVAVDFTTPDSVSSRVQWCVEHGIHAVVGTSGLTDADMADIGRGLRSGTANVFVAPNFALGAVLMMRFASQAAPYFQSAEIVERHHEGKKDAPSGTSLRTAELMNAARGRAWLRPGGEQESLAGARGGDVDGIRIHSLRVTGSVAHQEVVLGATGETLTLRHDSLDRRSFMPGVILAIRKVSSRPGLTVGLEHLLAEGDSEISGPGGESG